MRQTIRSVDPMSLAKILGVLYAGIGLLIGAIVSLVSLLGFAAALGGGGPERGAFGMLFGVGAIIAAPIFYGILGLIGGLIAGFLFNVAAKLGGGLVIDLE